MIRRSTRRVQVFTTRTDTITRRNENTIDDRSIRPGRVQVQVLPSAVRRVGMTRPFITLTVLFQLDQQPRPRTLFIGPIRTFDLMGISVALNARLIVAGLVTPTIHRGSLRRRRYRTRTRVPIA